MIHRRRDDIQGLRAIAVAAVVCFHAGLPMPGGFTGVDVFFVISGFVISLVLLREWQDAGGISLRLFYFRRFKRLAPALSLVVATTMVLSSMLASPLASQVRVAALTGIGALFMVANGVIATQTGGYFQIAAADNPLVNMWSLSVEEQFYIVFPSALLLALIMRRRWAMARFTSILVIGAIAFISLVAVSLYVRGGLSPRKELVLGFYSPISRAWEFAIGAALALSAARPPPKTIATIVAGLGLLLLLISFFFITRTMTFPGLATALPVLGAMALIWAGSGPAPSNAISRAISTAPFTYMGDISYSWYLWHWPLIVFAATLSGSNPVAEVLAAIFSLVPAIASYHWLESPLRRYQPRTYGSGLRLGVLTTGPTLAICLLLMVADSRGYWSPDIANYQEAMDRLHAGKVAGCGDGYVPVSQADHKCDFNLKASGRPVYLVGDSNADQFSEAVIEASIEADRPVRIITKGGCAFLGRSWSDASATAQADCLTFVNATRRHIANARPGEVILGLSDSLWNYAIPVGPTPENQFKKRADIQRYLQAELTGLIKDLQNAGHKVVLLQPIPKFITKQQKVFFESTKCTTVEALLSRCPHKVTVSTDFERDLQYYARAAMREASMKTSSTLIDFYDSLCPTGQCSNVAETGEILYRDPGHLTVKASNRLAARFFAVLRETRPFPAEARAAHSD